MAMRILCILRDFMKKLRILAVIIIGLIASIWLSSCMPQQTVRLTETTTSDLLQPTITQTRLFDPTLVTNAQTPSPTQTSSSEDELLDCLQPSDDYSILTVNGHRLNQRTYEMLTKAAQIYDGAIDITGHAITQGSYTDAVQESFHTHAGGGAVDISVMSPGTFDILYDEIEPLIHALRVAGFAAWFRDFNNVYEGSPVHIHAIAIGDRDLSLAAREQLAGPFGYFWGYDGLPQDDNIPQRDPYGGPVICDWMIEMGYPNKTATPAP